MSLAPIVLFVYNRLNHTFQTIEALKKNNLAKESDLYIYSDGARNDDDLFQVRLIRNYLKEITGFKNVHVIEREKNYGLADNIIDGVSAIVKIYSKVIVLEDDIITSSYFLDFMNESLDIYEQNEKIMHISGYMYPIDTKELPNFFTLCQATCWGWATWDTSWSKFYNNIDIILKSIKPNKYSFNLDDTFPFYNQLVANKNRKIKTWAIFWYSTIFLHNAVAIHPKLSFTQNIGHDNTGQNCHDTDFFTANLTKHYDKISLTKLELSENLEARESLKVYFKSFKKNFLYRVQKKIDKMYDIYINRFH